MSKWWQFWGDSLWRRAFVASADGWFGQSEGLRAGIGWQRRVFGSGKRGSDRGEIEEADGDDGMVEEVRQTWRVKMLILGG